ncbi:MAG: methyltransferase domain-containing protein, partial [Gammaproteobacteria bacterium]|nr:methyltransferase domain-containing protein [Gammaproteobacteria bacterium]
MHPYQISARRRELQAKSGEVCGAGDEAVTKEASKVRRQYERIAPYYDLLDGAFEHCRYRRIRPLLFEGLSGKLLDVGVGTGRNMLWYPAGSDVIGVDLSPSMLRRAARRQGASPAHVALVQMDIARLAFSDAAFDAAVASFVFCTLPDALHVPALRELARVVKPGGSIRLMEYTRPRGGIRRWLAGLWAPWVRWAYGASFDRDPEPHLATAGLSLVAVRFAVGDLIRL